MQRNILKIALAYGMALLLSAVPAQSLNAAENIAESTIDTDAQSANASELHETYYVNAQNGLKMRSAPSKDSDVITLLPYGAEVTVIGTSNGSWCEIEYLNDSGYVAANYITRSDDAESNGNDDIDIIEEDESIPSTALSSERIQTTLGVTPIIIALFAAIIIMILLAIFTAYSFLKKDKNSYDNENDENDINDNSNDDDDDYYDDYDDNESNEYSRDECYDDEYYDDDE